MKTGARLWLVVLALGACNGPVDASGPVHDAGGESSDADVTPAGTCQANLADACAMRQGACVMDWPADVSAFCLVHNASSPSSSTAVANACGPYLGLRANATDMGTSYYYDASTGKLVAFVDHNYNTMTAKCFGGPADFIEPKCSWDIIDCSDAGTGGSGGTVADGGIAGAGGAP